MLGQRVAGATTSSHMDSTDRAGVLGLAAAHWPLLLVVGLVTLFGLPSLAFVYGPDQALFAYAGHAIAHGQALYVDVWDVKPPGVFWIYALVTAVTTSAKAVRAFDLLYTAATVTAIYALGRHLWGRAPGAIAGLLYGTVYVTGSGYWNMAQPDSFMVLPAVLAVLAWDRGLPGSAGRTALIAGLLFGFAFQFRPVVALLPALLVLWELRPGSDRGAALRRVLWMSAGFAAFQLLTLLYLAVGGGLDDYLYAQFRFARKYASLGGPYAFDEFSFENYVSGLRGSVMWFIGSRLTLTAPALAALLLGGVLRADRGVRLVALLLAGATASVAIQAKFFVYHWHIVLPFLALLAAWTVCEVWVALRVRLPWPRAALTAALCVVGLLLLTPQITDGGMGEWRDAVRYVLTPSYRGTYYDRFGLRNHGTYSFLASEEASGYVRSRTNPGDTVFVWGYDPNLYLMSGRDSASRFLSLLPLMPLFTPESWKQEFVRDLETRRPVYILIQQGENARWITGRTDDSAAWVAKFTAFNDLLRRDYQFELRIEDYELYRIR